MKQSQLFAAMPKQPEPPKSYLELKHERERAEDEAMADRHWEETEKEEPEGLEE